MISEKSWEEFREVGLLWWINSLLHMFGWAIVYDFDDSNKVVGVYPARVGFRGFGEKQTSEGYRKVSSYLARNAAELEREAYE